MRTRTVAAATLAFALGMGTAQAIEVHQTATVKGTPEAVWAKIGDFCAINEWLPAVQACEVSEEGGATYRTLALPDGASIKERLIEETATGYTYEIVESPLPVANYRSTFSVMAEGDGTTVDWHGTFDAKDASNADAEGVIAGIYKAGLDEITSTNQ